MPTVLWAKCWSLAVVWSRTRVVRVTTEEEFDSALKAADQVIVEGDDRLLAYAVTKAADDLNNNIEIDLDRQSATGTDTDQATASHVHISVSASPEQSAKQSSQRHVFVLLG
jgi:hypothetical protein